ncbi:phage tail protein [Novosphingobium huizhouense]|uniref:fibronectin type III domain-containing protein n=1 Tax=Novosphingobium huizhouense TaxID=2866625 RepID=UPI001CD8587C|nr:fibronectin type III domain-containing protein [Novosphingobium huizhouense]
MPQAIAAFIGGVAFAATTVGQIVGWLVLTAITTGLSALVTSVFGPARPKPSDGQLTARGSVESRRRNYGIVHTGGVLTFEESSNGTLGIVVTQGTGEETEILEHRINDRKVTLDGSGTVTEASYRGAIHIYTRLGTASQTAISQLTAKFSQWTSNHRQRGCTHAAIICDPVKQKYFSEVFNGREPVYTSIRKGVKVYDPRLDSTAGGSGPQRLNDRSTWAWNDNAALVIGDYAAHEDGYGLGYENVNWANIAAQADICDQTVTTVTAATIKRWRLWASYQLSKDERRQVLADMLKACDGFCWQGPDFKFNLLVGAYEAPTLTITDDHILALGASLGPKAQQRVSTLKMLYTEAAIGYREQESAGIDVPGADEDPNTDPQAIQLYYAPHHNQAQRVGKLMAARLGDRWHLDLSLNLFGLNLLGRRFVRIVSEQFPIDATFAIDSGVKINIGRTRTTIQAGLIEVRPEDWAFDASAEEGTPPIAPDTTSAPVVIAVPTGLALSAVQIALSSGGGVAIAATWSPDRADLAYEVRYRPTAGGDWVMMTVDNDALTARSGPVDTSTQYEVQIRAVTLSYRASAWSSSVTITPVASNTPSAPASLAATGAAGSASITFRMPVESSLAYARLYRGTSSSFGSATQVGGDIVGALGEVKTISDTGLSAGTKYYWARAFTSSGGAGALAGPVTATVT